MADENADESYAAGEESRITSIQELADKVDWLISKLGGGGGGKPAEDPKDNAASVQDMVRAELDRKEKERAAAEARDKEKAEHEDLKATVAKLAEKPPAQPVPRRQKFLGWGE